MQNVSKLGMSAIMLLTLALTGASCSSVPEEPIEQIIIRVPGEESKQIATESAEGIERAENPESAANAERNTQQQVGDLVAEGKASFAACVACHSIVKDDSSGVGANLYGVVGRKAAALDDFSYSLALEQSGLTWSAAELDAFIANPSAKVPGTNMSSGAVSSSQQRKAIIAYLSSLSD